MKKILSVAVSLLLLCTAVLLPLTASAEITMVEVTKGASIRSKPGFNGEKLTMASVGSQYLYLGTEGTWYEVQVDAETKGYLPKDSCKLVKAAGIPLGSTKEAFTSIILSMKQTGMLETALPETFFGKTVIGVYSDLNGQPDELSTEMLARDGSYWSIPDELLAEKMADTDWALLVYPEITKSEDDPIHTKVFAVDVKNKVYYAPYYIDDHVTVLENEETSYELDSTLRGMEEFVFWAKWEHAIQLENDENYQAGLQYMKEEKYYSAYVAFGWSSLEEAEEMAKSCIKSWPKTGEIWHNSSIKGKISLTVKVNQDSERAMLMRIFKGDTQVSCLFIGGTGQATVKLPAGTYTIKDGTGYQWFGLKEAFGRDGDYEVMTFGENDQETVTLESRYDYTIRVNVSDSSSSGEGIGSRYEDWDNFAQ